MVITANEHIKQPTFTLGAGPNTVAFVSDTRVWSATRTMTNADATGTVAWSITWEDLAGNPGAYVTAATSDPHITFDKTYPYIGGVAIVSDSLFNSWKATAEDGVTFVFSESEIIEVRGSGCRVPWGVRSFCRGFGWGREFGVLSSTTCNCSSGAFSFRCSFRSKPSQ